MEDKIVVECMNGRKGIGVRKFMPTTGYEYPTAIFPELTALHLVHGNSDAFRVGVPMQREAPPIPTEPEKKAPVKRRGRRKRQPAKKG